MKLFVVTCIFFIGLNLYSQKISKVDQTELIRELQKWNKTNDNMSFSFWIPNSYWRVVLSENKQVPKEFIDKIESVFKNYILLIVGDLKIELDGTMTYTEESFLRKSISITDKLGENHYPLSSNQITPDTNDFVNYIKPMFAQMLGQMGKGMHIYLFDIKNQKNENIINELETGEFIVKHSEKEFKWNLPLVSLLETKYCPIDKEEMKGNWNFCPIHGIKLSE